MEPLFFKAENLPLPLLTFRRSQPLQWSRFFSKRKIMGGGPKTQETGNPSMEPLFFKAENAEMVDFIVWTSSLQWSRFFSKRKMLPSDFFVWATDFPLQWSRFFSKRKIRGECGGFQRAVTFNGAAFFQSGKCVFWWRQVKKSIPLQWSRFFSKRKITGKKPV